MNGRNNARRNGRRNGNNAEARRVAALAAMLAAAPRPPATRVFPKKPSLDERLAAMRAAILARRAARARENEDRRLAVLALRLPAAPRTRVFRR